MAAMGAGNMTRHKTNEQLKVKLNYGSERALSTIPQIKAFVAVEPSPISILGDSPISLGSPIMPEGFITETGILPQH